MPRRAQNFIWRKSATPQWVADNERRLHEATGGTHAAIERPNTARVLLESFCETRERAAALKHAFGGSIRPLPSDWREQFFTAHRTPPLRIGRRLIIASDATEAGSSPSLIIPASVAFGTGGHATTAMSLRMLERISRRRQSGWRMLDAGTGSGILALAGYRFGAGKVIAIDNDAMALGVAQENARFNGIPDVQFSVRDVQKRIRGTFDIITANLFSELLISVLPNFRDILAPDGCLILSGVLRQQEKELTGGLRANGFRAREIRRRGKWIALLCSAARHHGADEPASRRR